MRGSKAEVFAEWLARMRRARRTLPNIYIKLGGLGMKVIGLPFYGRAKRPTSQELVEPWRPYIEPCIELFDVERCMFESNFGPDKGSCDYVVVWNTFKRLTANYSASEKAALFRDTAARLYHLDPLPRMEI